MADPCFYCGGPMLDRSIQGEKQRFLSLFGMKPGDPYSLRQIRRLARTKEHLQRRADGGTNRKENIVFAHAWCNRTRDTRTVQEHLASTALQIQSGTHPFMPIIPLPEAPTRPATKQSTNATART